MLSLVFAITPGTGIKLAEVGFLLILIAGLWLVAAEIPALHRLDCARLAKD